MVRTDSFSYNGNQFDIEIDEIGEQVISHTRNGQSFFLTGKAGTGKTTLIHYLQDRVIDHNKKIAILAPTGIAAKNAGGITIHSFLRLPLSIYLPRHKIIGLYKLNQDSIEVVRSIDIMIIDEISMVRCDVFDMMDDVLRHYRKNDKPFGGIQLILVGDLYQLMPVAEDADWDKLKAYYNSVFFFNSQVYQNMHCPMLELNKVHRQEGTSRTAEYFVNLLNNVREGIISKTQLNTLQNKYDSNAQFYSSWIYLTTHRTKAWAINNKRLNKIYKPERSYEAEKIGYFPQDDYPTDSILKLKEGARVMFVKNDNISNLYKNGTLGRVVELTDDFVVVKIDDTKQTVVVSKEIWENQDYYIDKKTKTIETRVCGSFKQIPLKLAWAITIHKSQGLTFDKAVIDVGSAFTAGQVYVALSRCKRLKNIRLASEITRENIMVDPNVVKFYKNQSGVVERDLFEEYSIR